MNAAGRNLRRWLIATGIAHAAGAAAVVARPWDTTRLLGRVADDEMEDEPMGVYHALAAAYMATLAALSLGAAAEPSARRALAPPIIVAEASASAALLLRYAQTRKRGFAAGAAVEGALVGVTTGLYAISHR